MTLSLVLFILRVVAGLVLIGFLITLGVIMRRDQQILIRALEFGQHQRGRLLVVASSMKGVAPGTAFPLLPLTSIGRAMTNAIVLDDSFVSSDHAVLTLRAGQWWLEDRGSSNGTLLNGDKVTEPIVISTGDVISIGQVALRIEVS
jgi:hypothetical protein